jgi:BMFP domain-containing protein YqiC
MNTDKQSFLKELQERLTALMQNSPTQDIERNMKAMLGQAFSRMELVTRDEFDAQVELLASLHARIGRLETVIDKLETQAKESTSSTPANGDKS